MKLLRGSVIVFLILLCALPLAAQRRRDPLTDAETDQLREVADQPDLRLKLWVKFIKARMLGLDQLRSDPKFAPERGKRTHDMLEDIAAMIDELDDNVDNFSKQKLDMRKGLKEVIEMTSELQLKLRAVKEAASSDSAGAKEAADYKFVLDNAVEAVNQSADNSRETLQEQNELFKKKEDDKKKKK